MVHSYLVMIRGLASVQRAMAYVENLIPWNDIASFLTFLMTPERMTSRVLGDAFPIPDDGGRPLPEDFVMRGQLSSKLYFSPKWFATVNDGERYLELQSMEASRVERILWLGVSLTKHSCWLSFDARAGVFTTPYGKELPVQLS